MDLEFAVTIPHARKPNIAQHVVNNVWTNHISVISYAVRPFVACTSTGNHVMSVSGSVILNVLHSHFTYLNF